MEPQHITAINHFFINNPLFTIPIAISGVIGVLLYASTMSKGAKQSLKRRLMTRRINNLRDHYIICGFGRVGQQIAKELADENVPFVIIEREEDKLKLAKEHEWLTIVGDVALDESLFVQAHIDTAKTVIIAVGTDADAIFMAVSAKAMKKDIFIVARASSVEAADKLSKIGVNRVALPYQIGGYHMATMALRPTVVDFLDLLIDQERNELEIEEFIIHADEVYDGKHINDLEINDGLSILAIKKASGQSLINPKDDVPIQGDDRIVVLGPKPKIDAFAAKLAKNQGVRKKHPDTAKTEPETPVDIKPSPFQEK